MLHHDRKAGADDFVDRVSGTNGLAGSADTVLVLSRERQAEEGVLALTGRDVVEAEYALTMVSGTWTLDGATLTEAAHHARQRAAAAGVGDVLADIIGCVKDHPDGIGPTAIAEALDLDVAKVRVYLRRALDANRVRQHRRGAYLPVTSVTTHREQSTHGDTSNGETDLHDEPLWPEEAVEP